MSIESGDLTKLLLQNLTDVKIEETGKVSLLEDFPEKTKVSHFSDLRVLQIALARQAIVIKTGYLGKQLNEGKYLETGTDGSSWELYHLNDRSGRVAVLWSHFDDDSWSVFFKSDNLELDFLVYEN